MNKCNKIDFFRTFYTFVHNLGFGAKLPPNNEVSHQFPLNNNSTHPYCSGVEGILNHYRRRAKTVTMSGPTNFAPVINSTIAIARQYEDGRHYFILLIITDGQISDLNLTKRAIINASSLPISIIIVGVGDASFDSMDALDSDDALLTAGGQYASRDIVQFVPMNQFLSNNKPNQCIKSQIDLARKVLEEVPYQLTAYFESKGINPRNTKLNESLYPSLYVPSAPMP